MSTSEAAGILIVFWALMHLTEQKCPHTNENIIGAIGGSEGPQTRSVAKYLDCLEKWGAVKANYTKKKRNGRRDTKFSNLRPEKIPPGVWKHKIPYSTAYNLRQKFIEKNIARYEEGTGAFGLDARGFVDLGGDEFVNTLRDIKNKTANNEHDEWTTDDAAKWFITTLDGQKKLIDPNTFEIFHQYLFWKLDHMKR